MRLRSLGLTMMVGALVLGGLTSNADAQGRATQQRARQLYGEAQTLFDSGQYAAAEASFQAAYSAVPNPVVLRAIAASQERQGNIAQSISTLQRYLRESPGASDRAQIDARIRDMNSRPAIVVISSTPPGAQVMVDGRATGQTTPADVSMTAGQHTVELRLQGYAPASQTFSAQAATRVRLDMPLQPGAGGDAMGGAGGDGQGAAGGGGGGSGGSSDPSAGVWITAGIGVAGLVSGTVFGFLALSEQSNYEDTPTQESADLGVTFALVADISFGVAGAMAITAIVLYIVERTSAESSAENAHDDGLDFALAPYADPTGAGMAAQLRF